MYLAVNLVHRVNCTRTQSPDCPSRGAFHYNTEVVFDRSGKIVARCGRRPRRTCVVTTKLSCFNFSFHFQSVCET